MTERPPTPADDAVSDSEAPADAVAPIASPAAGMTDRDLAAASLLCPYVLADGGAWRSVAVAREHRCGAVDPPAALAPEKQRRLCLTAMHEGCATFRAAQQALLEPGGPDDDVAGSTRPSLRWAVPSTTPVVLERGRPGLARLRVDRSMAQVGLALLMVGAFVILALARLSAEAPAPSPVPSIAASPTVGPSASPSPSPSPDASVSPSPSGASSAPSPSPSGNP